MYYSPPKKFQYPSTRYSGSKRRLLPWIWSLIKDVEFNSVLDVFGGTGSVSLLFKYHGKKVHFNDILLANRLMGIALIQNSHYRVTEDEFIKIITDVEASPASGLIQEEFKGIYFTDEENAWLDSIIVRLQTVQPLEKQALLMIALFQACLVKRPYNLFHRANLYMRLADVERSFGNKKTWETPFPTLMWRYLNEYNSAIFSNQQHNLVVGGFDALSVPNGVDLVYLDPPYLSSTQNSGINYLDYYHFLEGLADYSNWEHRIEYDRKTKGFRDIPEIDDFARSDKINESFEKLLQRFKENLIVLSYHDDGNPSKETITEMLTGLGKQVSVHHKSFKYALSPKPKHELLFVAT